jgi:apolipoprotein D and lipocalin family protein
MKAQPPVSRLLPVFAALLLAALSAAPLQAVAVPEGLEPVRDFELERYLGLWYEIARLDHFFERGMDRVTAEYTRRPDGSITVVNRGYRPDKGKWKESRGLVKPKGDPTVGSLKVSFFRPFWGGYHIIALDREHYRWAVGCGPDRTYFWILSRDKVMDPDLLRRLVEQAKGWGFHVEKFIYPRHD